MIAFAYPGGDGALCLRRLRRAFFGRHGRGQEERPIEMHLTLYLLHQCPDARRIGQVGEHRDPSLLSGLRSASFGTGRTGQLQR